MGFLLGVFSYEEKNMKDKTELEVKILKTTIDIFNEKGFKVTMNDIATGCGISKKTIYKVFYDKEDMFNKMVDFLFEGIKEEEDKVINDASLSTENKIRKILGVLPESYMDIDFNKLHSLSEGYPKIYEKVKDRLESGWEPTIRLLEQGKDEGVIRKDVNISIVKMMFESTLEHFFQRDILDQNSITFQSGLEEVVDIIVDGIVVKGNKNKRKG